MYRFFCKICCDSTPIIKHHVHLTLGLSKTSKLFPSKDSLPGLIDENDQDAYDVLNFVITSRQSNILKTKKKYHVTQTYITRLTNSKPYATDVISFV